MSKPWRLTRQAEATLLDIALWTIENFGPRQAHAYEEDLIACCSGIASDSVATQSCRTIIAPDLKDDLRFTRSGQHFIVFVEDASTVIIVDFLHARCDLPAKLARMGRRDQ